MTKEQVLAEISALLDRRQVGDIRAFAIYVIADGDRMISLGVTDPHEKHPLSSVIDAAVIGSAYKVEAQAILDGMYYLARADAIGKPVGAVSETTGEPSFERWKALKLEDA